MLSLSRHKCAYLPLIPDAKVVRVRGVFNETSLVMLWLWWYVDLLLWSDPHA